ncbi:MAG: PBP1A family penicillin-binding protein [Deltaproteobacteria bacterium]|nr:PBP1A family penicillin-binding protein [Deltaproteobacteria bacterium]
MMTSKTQTSPPKKPGKTRKLRWMIFFIILFFLIIPGILAVGTYTYFSYDLPRLTSVEDYTPKTVTQVFSENGEIIAEFFVEKRYIIPIEEMPATLIRAFISSEDARFFEHQGIDLLSISRALIKNIKSMNIVQGGSTITQQITKSLLLSPEKSYTRKIKEAILARRIENSLSKRDILSIYLNQIYLGHRSYGVEAAALTYFGKHASELNLAESALLAGLPKAPSAYSPIRHPLKAQKRQRYVLQRMLQRGYITKGQAKEAADMTLNIVPPENKNIKVAPYFTEYLRQYLENTYGTDLLYGEGLKVYTPLNLLMQKSAQRAVESGLNDFETREGSQKDESRVQGALVAMEPRTGHVKALVGGVKFLENQFNRAIQARRQLGSAFKPIVYAAALDKDYVTTTIIIDSPLIFKIKSDMEFWEPRNYDLEFKGPITLRKALAYSRNIITIKILQDIGIDYVINYAKRLGIDSPLNRDLSLALGSSGISLLEITRAYAVFANQGFKVEPIFITKVTDRNGTVLEENKPRLSQAISPQTSYIMTSLLKSVVEEGTGRKVKALHRPCAGKTGTTNDVRDAWFIGFTPHIIAGTWVGFDDEKPLGKHETGAVAASPIWLKFMQEVLEGTPMKTFSIPEGIIFVKIDPETGKPPSPQSQKIIFECFKEELPTETQDISFLGTDERRLPRF